MIDINRICGAAFCYELSLCSRGEIIICECIISGQILLLKIEKVNIARNCEWRTGGFVCSGSAYGCIYIRQHHCCRQIDRQTVENCVHQESEVMRQRRWRRRRHACNSLPISLWRCRWLSALFCLFSIFSATSNGIDKNHSVQNLYNWYLMYQPGGLNGTNQNGQLRRELIWIVKWICWLLNDDKIMICELIYKFHCIRFRWKQMNWLIY